MEKRGRNKTDAYRFFLWLYSGTFLMVLPMLLHSNPHSPYSLQWLFQMQTRKSMISENTKRTDDALHYLTKWDRTKARALWANLSVNGKEVKYDEISVAFGVLSRDRISAISRQSNDPEPRYLTQVVARLIHLLDSMRKGTVHFPYDTTAFICNVETNPAQHQEAMKLSNVIRVVNVSRPGHVFSDVRQKMRVDYAKCLQEALSLNPSYVFILEDDALPKDNLLPIIHYLVSDFLEHHHSQGNLINVTTQTAYVKLYHVRAFINPIYFHVLERASIGCLVGGLLTLIVFYRRGRRWSYSVYRTWFLFSLYIMGLLFAVGTANLVELRNLFPPYTYSLIPAPSSHTQAMLYPRLSAQRLAEFLLLDICQYPNRDFCIHEFVNKHNLNAYYMNPHVVDHIGVMSSFKDAENPAFL